MALPAPKDLFYTEGVGELKAARMEVSDTGSDATPGCTAVLPCPDLHVLLPTCMA